MEDSQNVKFCKLLFWYTIVSSNFAALTVGMFTTWTSPVLSKLLNVNRLGENPIGRVIYVIEESWIVSSLSLGAMLGPLFGGFLADEIGRKLTLMGCVGLPFMASFLILAFSKTTPLYYMARFIGGLGVGNLFTVLPVYFGEIGQSDIRGGVICSVNIFVSLGEMYGLSVGPFVSIKSFSLLCTIFPGIFLITFIFAPESPYFYLIKGHIDKAEETMAKLQGSPLAISSARTSLAEVEDLNRGEIVRVIWGSKGYRKALLMCFGLVAFQQLCGIYAIRSYVTIIFEATGATFSADFSAIVVGGVQVFASFVTPFIVDVVGRKTLLLTSAIGMFFSECFLGIYFYINDYKKVKGDGATKWGWAPFGLLAIYIVSYNLGFRPLPWTIVGEVFPVSVRSISSMAMAMVYWILHFVVTNLFPVVVKAAGMGPTFWILSILCIFAAIFSKHYLIETKGKTFDEIQEELNK